MSQNYSDLTKNRSLTDSTSSEQIKTTDVNILLNRVRLNEKKMFKKNILFFILSVTLVCSIGIFYII